MNIDRRLACIDKQQYLNLHSLQPSGLGGVLPGDHFMISVTTRRQPEDTVLWPHLDRSKSKELTNGAVSRLPVMITSSPGPTTLFNSVTNQGVTQLIDYVSTSIEKLQPVPLPHSAMFIPPLSSDESSCAIDYTEEDTDDEFV